jgi:hypothetical protein
MNRLDEFRHLCTVPNSIEALRGLGLVRFDVQCQDNSAQVLLRVREVLQQLLSYPPNELSSQLNLPDWLIGSFAPEKSMEEAEQWLKWWKSLPKEEQEIASKEAKWSLEDWLYWMQPDMRQWFWWDAIISDESTIKIAVQVNEYPFAWGSLEQLFKAAGATAILPEEN